MEERFMTQLQEVYKCSVCGNIVEVVHTGKGELVCCNRPMGLMQENTVDASKEKHVPVIEVADGMVTVKIGSVPHPMESKHYIEWVELIDGSRVFREYTEPGKAPEVSFKQAEGNKITARAYCNLHGLWSALLEG
jgi:superoxide reductase